MKSWRRWGWYADDTDRDAQDAREDLENADPLFVRPTDDDRARMSSAEAAWRQGEYD